MDELDYTQEDEITCPYCGDKNVDSWEVRSDINCGELGVQECGNCDKKFIATRNMHISYDSKPAPCLNSEKEHDWKHIIGVPKEYFKGKFRCSICGIEEIRKKN